MTDHDLRSAAIRCLRQCPRDRTWLRHIECVWFNFCDAFASREDFDEAVLCGK